jgi:hypothetical protein
MLVSHNEIGPDIEIGWRQDRAAWGGSEADLRSMSLAEKIGLQPITAIEHVGSEDRVYDMETEPLELRSKIGR